MFYEHRFYVLVNRIPGEPFKPEIGIRYGQLISPYIFIIYAEYLSPYIYFVANIPKSGIDIKVAKNCPTVPYLMFVDDCLIFCKANRTAARNQGYFRKLL